MNPALIGPPSPWILRFAPLVRGGGGVLDVAAGRGRHARLFAARGHPVLAVDRDIAGLAGAVGVEAVELDLEAGGPLPVLERRHACILGTNYLWRPLFPRLLAALEPGGLFLWETFQLGHERLGRPSCVDFLLRPGELLEITAGLTVIAYEAGEITLPRPAIIQRIAARSGGAVSPLPPG